MVVNHEFRARPRRDCHPRRPLLAGWKSPPVAAGLELTCSAPPGKGGSTQ